MHAQQQTDCNWASMYTGMELDQNQARHNGDITFVHFSTSDADNPICTVYARFHVNDLFSLNGDQDVVS